MAYRAILFDFDGVLVNQNLHPVPGIESTLKQLYPQWAGRMACVSAASQKKLDQHLRALGLHHYFSPHIYSGQDAPRNTPHPDVYLKAVAGLGQGITAQQCAVIEDSYIGIRAAAAAGTQVLAYTADTDPAQALKAGALRVFDDMHQLPALLNRQRQTTP